MMEQQVALIMCIALGIFLLIKEYLRPNKLRMAWRMIASLLAVLSFYFLLFPLKHQSTAQAFTQEINLFTTGTPVNVKPSKGLVYTNDRSLHVALKGKAAFIPDLSLFLKTHPDLTKVNLYGYGLNESELGLLKDYEVNYQPAAFPSGVLKANWNRRINQTEDLIIQGIYHHAGKQPLKLVLKGLGLHLDSVKLKPETVTKFSLKTRPPLSGRGVYQLLALNGNDTLANEPVPFEMVEVEPMKILMLASYPDFEYKFLKNWLYENKYPVVFRSQISKGKYSTDYLNTENTSVNTITANVLKNTDLIIVDEDTWATLSGAETAAINTAVRSGLGLLLRAKAAKATRLSGRGKIVVTAVADTYSLLLEGKKTAYAEFWSGLIKQGARKKQALMQWQVLPEYPVVGTKSRIVVEQSAGSHMPGITMAKDTLALRQNMEKPFQWDAFFWPVQSGWHSAYIDKQAANFYVFDVTNWRSNTWYNRLMHTNAQLDSKKSNKQTVESNQIKTKTLSSWWYFTIFLLSAGYLWYEARFFRNKIN